tara:strand:- start:1638 stop:2009 length:372 start_codon:yes stop_codon:yes gene_type:complete
MKNNNARSNKLFLIVLSFLLFYYTFNDNFKVLINTNYNKYSNILEVNINRLHNKLIDESNLIINSTTNEIDKTFSSRTNLVMLITIFTGVFFIFMNFYNNYTINSTTFTLYFMLLIITFYLLK